MCMCVYERIDSNNNNSTKSHLCEYLPELQVSIQNIQSKDQCRKFDELVLESNPRPFHLAPIELTTGPLRLSKSNFWIENG